MHDDRPAAERIDHVRPRRRQRQQDGHLRPERSLVGEEAGLTPARYQHRPVGGDRLVAAVEVLRDRADERRVRPRRRERLDDRLRTAVLGRRARAPCARVQRGAVRTRRLVDPEDASLPGTLPRPGQAHAVDVQVAAGVDPDGRSLIGRCAVEDAGANEPAGRMAVRQVEEVAVDCGDGRLARDTLLHRGHALAPQDRVVREHGPDRVQTARLRGGDDVDDHGAVRGEFHLLRVDDARQECLAADRRGCRGDSRDRQNPCTEGTDDRIAHHDPGRG